jgi:hypothetical protein
MTKKQQEEIQFLEAYGKFNATESEKQEYINITVHGKGKTDQDKFSTNRLRNCKQKLNVMIDTWREDVTVGLLSVEELRETFPHPYFQKIVDRIVESVTPTYRRSLHHKMWTPLAVSNFV